MACRSSFSRHSRLGRPTLPFWGAFRRSTALKIEAAGNALIDADKYVCQVAGDVAGCADDILDNDRDPSSSESLSARMRAMTSAAIPAVKPQRERLFDLLSRAMVSER